MAAKKKTAKKRKSKHPLKLRTEDEYQELREMTVALANCAVLTLASKGKLGVGTGMILDRKTGVARHWSTQFFDALDAVGLVYDRVKFFAKPSKKR